MLSLPFFRLFSGECIALLCTITFLYLPAISFAQNTQTTVSLRAQTNPVSVGDIASLECQISNPPTSFAVTFLRRTATANERLTWAGSVLDEFNHRMRITERADTHVLTIYDVTIDDEGDYTCEVYDSEAGTSAAQDKLSLRLQQDSSTDTTPTCDSIPDLSRPIREGEQYTLLCTSAESDPRVSPEWSNTFGALAGQFTETRSGIVTTSVLRRATLEDNNAVFICSVKNPAFPEKESQLCHVGPLTVQRGRPDPLYYTRRPDAGEPTDKVQIVDGSGKTKRVIEKCMAFCSALVDLE